MKELERKIDAIFIRLGLIDQELEQIRDTLKKNMKLKPMKVKG